MEYEVHESAKALPRVTMNAIWYLWELYGKDQEVSSFVLTHAEGRQEISVLGTEYVQSFEMATPVQGVAVISLEENTATMRFRHPSEG